ncbi:MAG: hypothetical protein J3K34DRAFT_52955 [Monoraphidium minutum]|nr:MAG: hypothetical protein J3K34DRAFT_52955 [Monoraphidium minutum]
MVRNHVSDSQKRSDIQKRQKAEVIKVKSKAVLQQAGMTREQAEKDPVKFIIKLWPQLKKDVKRLSERWLATRGVFVMLEEGQDALYDAAGVLTIPKHPFINFGQNLRRWYPGLKTQVKQYNGISPAAALTMLRTPGRPSLARTYEKVSRKVLSLTAAIDTGRLRPPPLPAAPPTLQCGSDDGTPVGGGARQQLHRAIAGGCT